MNDIASEPNQRCKKFNVAFAALVTLALCVAALLLISVLINSVLLRRLPFPTPDQLARMFDASSNSNIAQGQERQIGNGKPQI